MRSVHALPIALSRASRSSCAARVWCFLARVRIAGGVHAIDGSAPFGILVYGFGSYTSCIYPGGLDLREIAPPI